MAKLIHISGKISRIDVSNYETINRAIQGYFEVLNTCGKMLLINEDGIRLNLPFNFTASIVAKRALYGNVIVCEQGELR